MKRHRRLWRTRICRLACIAAGALAALAAPPALAQELTARLGAPEAADALLLRTTTDLDVLGPVIEAYLEDRPDMAIDYEQWGSNDLHALSLAACAGDAPAADLVISSAVHHMVDLVNDGCATAHRSPATAALPEALRWRDELWGVTREPAVMVVNRDLVADDEIPWSRFDLLDLLRPADSRYRGRVATYDIEASGLGYLFAFADARNASTFGALLESFGSSGAIATCCSSEIIDGVVAGDYLIAYNVLGSYALQRAAREPRLAVIAPSDYTLVLSRAAMIPARSGRQDQAVALLEYLLSPAGRDALRRRNLVVEIGGAGAVVESDIGQSSATSRLIGLSPALLVALDAHKTGLFVERWREAFR
ncbi:MAG: ABC transporter substrate-binding protein [Pseudomonadota bacterium]